MIGRWLQAAGRVLFWPLLWFVDRQLHWLDRRVADRFDVIESHLGDRLERLHARIANAEQQIAAGAEFQQQTVRLIDAAAAEVGYQRNMFAPLATMEQRMIVEADLAAELRAEQGRTLAKLHDRLAEHGDVGDRVAAHLEQLAAATAAVEQSVALVGEGTAAGLRRHIDAIATLTGRLNRGFEETGLQAEGMAEGLRQQLDALATLTDRVNGGFEQVGAQAEGAATGLRQQLDAIVVLTEQINTALEQIAHVRGVLDANVVLRPASDGDSEGSAQLTDQTSESVMESADHAARSFVNRPIEELGEGCAELLNYATGHRGFSAQAGLWFNHPLYVEHRPGGVGVASVNERIVEVPYVLQALAGLAEGSHILDFGATENTLALSLASMGHDVVALDFRPYPLQHPRLTAVASPAESWEGPQRPFDAIISLSTIEHVGLGHYGNGTGRGQDLDREILDRLHTWLRPGGLLVMTAPYGRWSVDDFQRTYDAEHLELLLERWTVCDRRYAISSDPLGWTIVEDDLIEALRDGAARAVIMLRATPS